VVQDVRVVATGILKSIGQNRHRREIARIVHLLGEGEDGGGEPGGIEADGAEGVAEDVTQQIHLDFFCFSFGRV
jgi:hypothetical protein